MSKQANAEDGRWVGGWRGYREEGELEYAIERVREVGV
jgi:hypothetical protein